MNNNKKECLYWYDTLYDVYIYFYRLFFKNGNFITLHDYFVRELTKICPDKHYSYDEHKVIFFQTLSTHVQHADIEAILDFYSSVKSDNISQVCKNFGIMKENTEDKTLENLMSEFYAKYSMLEFVSEYRIEESKHTIAQYLSGTARWSVDIAEVCVTMVQHTSNGGRTNGQGQESNCKL